MGCLFDVAEKERYRVCKYCSAACEHRIAPTDLEAVISMASIPTPRGRDEIDEWLEKECNIHAGCCSSVESLKYLVAREVAEKLWNKTKDNE